MPSNAVVTMVRGMVGKDVAHVKDFAVPETVLFLGGGGGG